eukprot:CAMPEP_0182824712 /NCGR_PEP_ID=MMETSP0006_2-20121128/15441_1 /TAXON_ID=97485 /ORGANISM="Prymnesium parvum, Strain Texoma1" /LENGTH=64 /DNA_ID=CAMNT_0024951737 /DNA_START=566 /DNA_END=760 /DNA_ORIENTATION=-
MLMSNQQGPLVAHPDLLLDDTDHVSRVKEWKQFWPASVLAHLALAAAWRTSTRPAATLWDDAIL